jgi:hypothetical protein
MSSQGHVCAGTQQSDPDNRQEHGHTKDRDSIHHTPSLSN